MKIYNEKKDTPDPYQVIAGFFDIYDPDNARERISAWMETVVKKERWREQYPANLDSFYQNLLKLIRAAYQIYRENAGRKTAIDLLKNKGYDIATNLLHPALYFGWGRDENIWTDFPRNLNLEEYTDPYLVFPPFFEWYGPAEWGRELYGLLSAARWGRIPAGLSGREKNVLLIQKDLLKLVEAAHLIDVREVAFKGEFKKRYPFTLDQPCEALSAARLLRTGYRERNKLKPGAEQPESSESRSGEEHDGDEGKNGSNDDDDRHRQAQGRKSNADILSRAFNSRPGDIQIIIRGECIAHPPTQGKWKTGKILIAL